MKTIIKTFTLFALYASASLAQGFNVSASGEQIFSFSDQHGRNQATFFSTTPLEDINGLTNDVNGSVTFDVGDLPTLRGTISLSTASLKTGIDLRDEHLRSANWLDADSYPENHLCN